MSSSRAPAAARVVLVMGALLGAAFGCQGRDNGSTPHTPSPVRSPAGVPIGAAGPARGGPAPLAGTPRSRGGAPGKPPAGPLPPPKRVVAPAGRYEPIPGPLVPPAPEGGPFNVLFISLDTVRADALGCYGHPTFRTPAIDALAASGARFDQVVTHIPETALSHWAIFTSVEPPLHGNVNRNGTSRYVGPLAQEIFKQRGYRTAAVIGGVTLRSDVGLHRGFDTYDEDYAFSPEHLKRPGAEVTDRAVAFLQAHAHDVVPFFLFVHYFDAHFPYEPPSPFDTLYDPGYRGDVDGSDERLAPFRDGKKPIEPRDLEHVKALYGGEISFLDTQVRRLIQTLDQTGVRKKTMVVLFSDHGESFGHGYYFNHAGVLYDATLRVPLVLSAPGIVPAGAVVDTQVRTIDILPTVLALLGIPGDVKFQGMSLAPLLHGEAVYPPAAFSLTDPWRPEHLESVRSEGWKLIVGPGDARVLFDLARDPGELHPVDARSHPVGDVLERERRRHEQRLEALAAKLKGPPPSKRPETSPEMVEQLKRLGYVR